MLPLALTAAALGSVAIAWMFERRRSRRRNKQGECAACGVPWAATPSGDPYLIHGRLVCEECAEKAKRRMPWHFGILAAAAAIGTGLAVAGADLAVMILLPAGSTIVMTIGAVQLMRLANRNAQRRIAAGEFPDFEAVGAEKNTEPKPSLPEGPGV